MAAAAEANEIIPRLAINEKRAQSGHKKWNNFRQLQFRSKFVLDLYQNLFPFFIRIIRIPIKKIKLYASIFPLISFTPPYSYNPPLLFPSLHLILTTHPFYSPHSTFSLQPTPFIPLITTHPFYSPHSTFSLQPTPFIPLTPPSHYNTTFFPLYPSLL